MYSDDPKIQILLKLGAPKVMPNPTTQCYMVL